ncbi:MAG: sigma-70 family RNA polymerase sigma factor [Thermoleophilaceae bacterium]
MSTSAPLVALEESTLGLDARDEQQLRRRVGCWAHRFFGLTDSEVEDCYQSAWLRVMEHARAGRAVRNLEHFLRWEVGNSWKMELRRRQRRPSVGFDDCPAGALRDALAPDTAEQVERRADLLALIGTMNPRRGQVLLLRDGCGFSPAEVCRRLGISRRAYREEHAEAIKEICARLR